MRKYLALCVVALLSGCSSSMFPSLVVRQYADTKDPSFAYLRVVGYGAILFPGSCANYADPAAGWGNNFVTFLDGSRRLGMPAGLQPLNRANEYKIAAGKPFSVTFSLESVSTGVYSYSCGMAGQTFTPEVGKSYEADVGIDGYYCVVRIKEISGQGAQYSTKPVPSTSTSMCTK